MKFTLVLVVFCFLSVESRSGVQTASRNGLESSSKPQEVEIGVDKSIPTTNVAKAAQITTGDDRNAGKDSANESTKVTSKEIKSTKAHNFTTPPTNTTTRCPLKCHCWYDVVDCSRAGKTEIPSINELPANTKVLDLTQNLISNLSAFDHLPKLTKLVLRHNSIEHIEPDVFTNSPNLLELDLSFNVKINLPANLLEPLQSLNILKMTDCGITKLDIDFFKKNHHLTHLHLDSNPLNEVNATFFKHLKELEFLDLTNTKLTSLNIGKEAPMNKLITLNVSTNMLELVPFFQYAPNIENLVLDYNRIGVLNKDSFVYLRNLESLELSHNEELLDVEELTFAQQTNLKRLVLSNNPHLFLISQHAFYGMYNNATNGFPLRELNLQKNSLHFISESLLTDHWGELDALDLRMNSWNCDCHLKWLHKYKENRNVSEIR